MKGAAHIGVLKALEEENVKFDYISGTSSGSIIATLWAVGYNSEEIYKIFNMYAKKIKYIEFKNICKTIYGLLIKRKVIIKGLNSGKVIETLINDVCEKKGIYNINQIKIPLLIPSVDLHSGEIYMFTSSELRNGFSDKIRYINNVKLGKAVRASCSYPGVFEPCKYENTELIDGGIRENIPWRGTKEMGADKVISVIFDNKLKENCCSSLLEVIGNSFDILCHELAVYELDGADYLLKLESPNISLLDSSQVENLYKLGYEETKKYIHTHSI